MRLGSGACRHRRDDVANRHFVTATCIRLYRQVSLSSFSLIERYIFCFSGVYVCVGGCLCNCARTRKIKSTVFVFVFCLLA